MIKRICRTFNKQQSKAVTKLKKCITAFYAIMFMFSFCVVEAHATTTGKLNAGIDIIKNLGLAILAGIGSYLLIFGVIDFASAIRARDTAQQTEGIGKLLSGLIMVFGSILIGELTGAQ